MPPKLEEFPSSGSASNRITSMIKKFHDYFTPVLKFLDSSGATHHKLLKESLAKIENLSDEEIAYTNDRGTNIFNSRIHWALMYLFQSGAIDRPAKATYAINDFGRKLIADHPQGFDVAVLEATEGLQQWGERARLNQNNKVATTTEPSEETPNENIESALDKLDANLAHQLLARIQEASPKFLEHTVLHLLEKMGYGDGEDSLEHLGGPGDEGVDGVINQDKLGLQRIYVQAKRYKTGNNISGENLQSFMGALKGKGASGGVFITTSKFTTAAQEYANKNIEPRIVLIDGVELGRLLVRHEVGVITIKNYRVMEIDENFFEEE